MCRFCDLLKIQEQREVTLVALTGSDTERESQEAKFRKEMSAVLLQNTKLHENYKSVCVELAHITEKDKTLEEHVRVLQLQVHIQLY